MTVKHHMTKRFLEDAYAGESQAHMRYTLFADIAAKEHLPNVAKLFKAIAYAELVHARNHYRALGNINTTSDNLTMAIDGETFEVDEMYPVYKNAAAFQKEQEAEQSASYALEAEKIHARLYQQAHDNVQKGKDIDVKRIYICPVCGYTAVDNAPDFCPVCGAAKKSFLLFE